jgi:hypothetical protein
MKTQQIAIAIMLVTAILGAPNSEAHASDPQADAVFLEGNFQCGGSLPLGSSAQRGGDASVRVDTIPDHDDGPGQVLVKLLEELDDVLGAN